VVAEEHGIENEADEDHPDTEEYKPEHRTPGSARRDSVSLRTRLESSRLCLSSSYRDGAGLEREHH
jgi:hypothetical protein